MSDEMIIRHCSPTLAGLKTGNIFSCPYSNKKELFCAVRSLNQRLVPYTQHSKMLIILKNAEK